MMTKRQLYRFAIRASRDPSLRPVLADALLEHPATRAAFERAIERAWQSVRVGWMETPVYVVFFLPALLSSAVGRRRPASYALFNIYGKGSESQSIESFIDTVLRIERRSGLLAVPVYLARDPNDPRDAVD